MAETEDAVASPAAGSDAKGRKRFEARPKKNVYLDKEYEKEMQKVSGKESITFDCWRCTLSKNSRNHYLWYTTQGSKQICNGCYGFLVGQRPKAPKPDGGEAGKKKQESTAQEPPAKKSKSGASNDVKSRLLEQLQPGQYYKAASLKGSVVGDLYDKLVEALREESSSGAGVEEGDSSKKDEKKEDKKEEKKEDEKKKKKQKKRKSDDDKATD